MKLSDRALNFAMRAHDGHTRKVDKDKPEVIHSMIVGDLLKYYGFDDVVVAAGYLHDVDEDTEFTVNDIARLFGGEVASLVMIVSDPDPTLPWIERKKQKIKIINGLPERSKALILADKIANLDDIRIDYQKKGSLDFSLFHGDFEDQKWYYEAIYKALCENFNHPMLDRLYENIQIVFYGKTNYSFKENNFSDTPEEHSRLNHLYAQREELLKLKGLLESTKPFVIEFTGTSRSDKTAIINIFCDFFKKGGFNLRVAEEFLPPKRYNKEFVSDVKSLSIVERNLLIASEIEKQLLTEISNGYDIILADRGLFDRLVWIQRMIIKNVFTKEDFQAYINYYLLEIKSLINYVVITYDLTSPKREYYNYESPAFEYNEALENCLALLQGHDNMIVDTSKFAEDNIALEALERLLPIMKTEYISQLKLMIENKKDRD